MWNDAALGNLRTGHQRESVHIKIEKKIKMGKEFSCIKWVICLGILNNGNVFKRP